MLQRWYATNRPPICQAAATQPAVSIYRDRDALPWTHNHAGGESCAPLPPASRNGGVPPCIQMLSSGSSFPRGYSEGSNRSAILPRASRIPRFEEKNGYSARREDRVRKICATWE